MSKVTFPEIKILTLERSSDRLEGIGARLNKLNLAYERFPGIDGTLEEEYCLSKCHQKTVLAYMRRPLITGEIACALGHLALWKSLETSENDTLLVLEDDADFDERILEIPTLIADLPDDWEILLLSTTGKQPLWQKESGNLTLFRHVRLRTFAIGYVIHRRLLAKRDRWDRPVRFAFDMWRFWIWRHGLAIYSVSPTLAQHLPDQKSVISGDQTRVGNKGGALTGLLLRLWLYPKAWLYGARTKLALKNKS